MTANARLRLYRDLDAMVRDLEDKPHERPREGAGGVQIVGNSTIVPGILGYDTLWI